MRYERAFVGGIERGLKKYPQFLHVVIGPRQVGKTTGVLQLLKRAHPSAMYVSADSDIAHPATWVTEQWLTAQAKTSCDLLVIDEIQKVHLWSEAVKSLWDEQMRKSPTRFMRLVLLGSSSIEVQKGLSESLAGRYYLHPVFHWAFDESRKAFKLSFEDYLKFGGYPASYVFREKKTEWLQYLRRSIIDPVLGRDILSMSRVKSPALFKQCFELACSYSAQEISYTKLLGQLQEKGNTELVKHYLELFEGAFLLKQVYKYSPKPRLARSSSPKILPLCPALYTVTLDADLNAEERGRAFEVVVGSSLARMDAALYYWREGGLEVDFVLKRGKTLLGVEVKSARVSLKGLEKFKSQFRGSEVFLVTPENFSDVLASIESRLIEG